jgi:hypothetical protein
MYESSGSLTAADVAAVTRNNNCNGSGMFGNDWTWIIILLLFGYNGFGFGGRGFGGFGGGYGNPATQADLAAGFNNSAVLSSLNDLKLGQAGIQQTMCQGFNGVNTTVLQGFNGVERGFCDISHQLSDCCCATQRAIDGVKYEMATQACDTRNAIHNSTRDIIDNANANSRAILDFLTQDKIATLTAENQNLKFAASQAQQNAYIGATVDSATAELIRRLGRDCPVPAYVVPNPNCCYNTAPNCGCGGSF